MSRAEQRISTITAHLAPQVLPDPVVSLEATTSVQPAGGRVCIVASCRTPLGGFQGGLSSFTAPQLGSIVIKEVLKRAKVDPAQVDEVYFGNVLQANVGQAPARQASLGAGLPVKVPCSTINKVCASGMKAVMIGAMTIQQGLADVIVAGGMESMSNAPYYLPKARGGMRMGNSEVVDGMIKDGLWDPYGNKHMGMCAEACSDKYTISRQAQDEYAAESYKRAKMATDKGLFREEIVEVTVPAARKGAAPVIIKSDEEVKDVSSEKLGALASAFKKSGTVTAGNASTISDGAAAILLMSEKKAKELGVKIIAYIEGFADAAQEPDQFTTSPALAIPLALSRCSLAASSVDFWEINEAFSVVALANAKILDIDTKKLNVYGGGVSMGHPIGCSGARIICTLLTILHQNNGKVGCAAICNGGGGASALVVRLA
eukprot:TRINITY_DN3281_c0_g1_i1.p1 TRINITY_DN3281_c0_g1~~TRINITY_DN3281_c0_g1_i1.p1  ORF type:complete len:431 (-),score=199.11 TRINITY_DN3281_c0_g1_i1:35-1327(-)